MADKAASSERRSKQRSLPRHPADSHRYRVAFLVHHYPVISEVFIMHAAAGLARRGHDVDIIPVHGLSKSSAAQHEIQRELDLDPHVRVVSPVLHGGRSRRWMAAPRAALELLRHRKAAVRNLFDKRLFGDAAPHLAIAVANALGKGGPYDIIHCQFASIAPLVVALRDAALVDGAVVVHFRGYDISQFVREQGPRVYEQVFARADRFIANCRAFADAAVSLGCDRERLSIVSSGCDVSRFPYLAARHRKPGEPLRLLAVGRLVQKKGFSTLVRAVAQVVADGLVVSLSIIGEGPLRRELEQLVADSGLGGVIELPGALPQQQIVPRLLATHIFIACSETAENGDTDAPVNTVKEAMATGAPVIGSTHGGIPELIEHGVNGMLFDEGDAQALAGSIRSLADAPERWIALGLAGRRTIKDRHSLDISTDGFLFTYREACLARASTTGEWP